MGPYKISGSLKGTLAPQDITSRPPAMSVSNCSRVTRRDAAQGRKSSAPASPDLLIRSPEIEHIVGVKFVPRLFKEQLAHLVKGHAPRHNQPAIAIDNPDDPSPRLRKIEGGRGADIAPSLDDCALAPEIAAMDLVIMSGRPGDTPTRDHVSDRIPPADLGRVTGVFDDLRHTHAELADLLDLLAN